MASGIGPLDALDLFDFLPEGPLAVLAVVVGVVILGIAAWLFVLPALLAVADVVIILAIAAGGVLGSVVLHRPWQIEAAGPNGELSWSVVGWRRGSRTISLVADRLRRGDVPPTDSQDFPPP
jgi:hypothetical protein